MLPLFGPSKFLPPVLNEEHIIPRARLLKRAAHRQAGKHHLFIEAQAGQGKTIFAHQFLRYQGRDFCWYRLDEEDNDPAVFALGLLECLKVSFPTFDRELLNRILAEGGADSRELAKVLGVLLAPLRNFGDTPRSVVFDNCHLVNSNSLSSSLLQGFVSGLPRDVQAVLLSRSSIFKEDLPLRKSASVIDNEFLAFQGDDANDLFRQVFELYLSPSKVLRILAVTRGWAAGLSMAGQEFAGKRVFLDELASFESVEEYFTANLAEGIPASRWSELLLLGFLDSFSRGMLEELLPTGEGAPLLELLETRNFFLRRGEKPGQEFQFNHLFSKFLRKRALTEISPEVREGFLSRAARWCLERDDYRQAFLYFYRGGNLNGAEGVLRRFGLHLYGGNELLFLNEAFEGTNPEVFEKHGWFALFAALNALEANPLRSLSLMEGALESSRLDKDWLLELLAAGLLLGSYCHLSQDLQKIRETASALEALLTRYGEHIEAGGLILAHNALSLAKNLAGTDFDGAARHAAKACELAHARGQPNLLALALKGALLCGLSAKEGGAADKAFKTAKKLSASTAVSGFNRMVLHSILAHVSYAAGHWGLWKGFRAEVSGYDDQGLAAQLSWEISRNLQDMDYALLSGDYEKGFRLAKSMGSRHYPSGRNLILEAAQGAQALALALLGKEEEARALLPKESPPKLEEARSPLDLLRLLYSGAARAVLGDREEAEEIFWTVLADPGGLPQEQKSAAANLNLAGLYHNAGDYTRAAFHLSEFQRAQRGLPGANVITLRPELLPVLSQAASLGAKGKFTRKTLMRLFGKSAARGEEVPALMVRTLGELSFALEGGNPIFAADLTITERRLLSHLLCAAGFSLEKETLASRLWPDSDRERSIASFDMALSRLRKNLDLLLGKALSRRYLVIKNGIVGFEHTLIDAAVFEEAGEKGLKLRRAGAAWQAHHWLHESVEAWEGEFLSGLEVPDEGYHRRAQLGGLAEEVFGAYCETLIEDGKPGGAVKAARKFLASNAASHRISLILYRAYSAANDPAGARSTYRGYAELLKKAGYSAEDIRAELSDFAFKENKI